MSAVEDIANPVLTHSEQDNVEPAIKPNGIHHENGTVIIEDSPSLDKTTTADPTASVQGGVTEDELKKEEESSATSELLKAALVDASKEEIILNALEVKPEVGGAFVCLKWLFQHIIFFPSFMGWMIY